MRVDHWIRSRCALALVGLQTLVGCRDQPQSGTSASANGASSTPAAASADPADKKIREAMRAMQDQPPEARQSFAGVVIAERGKGQLVEQVRLAFEELQYVPPDLRPLTLTKPFTTPEVVAAWKKACPAGPQAIAKMAELAPTKQGKYLFETCQLERKPSLDAAAAQRANGHALAAVIIAAEQMDGGKLDRDLWRWFLEASPATP